MKKRKRFTSQKSAESFAKKVNGQVNDLREIDTAKSPFTVTYKSDKAYRTQEDDWCPEEERDFGYSNEFWQ